MRLALALLFAASTAAGKIVLGPEHFVVDPRFEAVSAFKAAAVANGNETLVFLQTGASSSIYLQHVDAQGAPLTEHGIPLGRGISLLGGAASNGAGSIVFWSTDQEVWSVAIDSGGNASAPQLVSQTSNRVTWPYLATNGSDYLAAWTDWNGSGQQVMAVHLDSRGVPLGAPFALTERRLSAGVTALASDGSGYFAVIGTTLVSVDAGTKSDLPLLLRALVRTANGFIGFSDADNHTTAIAVDASGHAGTPVIVASNPFVSAASNGTDALALAYGGAATRVRRNGDIVETIDQTQLALTNGDAIVLHSGGYAAISRDAAATVMLLNGTVASPLLMFPATQDAPSIAAEGDLSVVAWREGTSVRAARIRGGTTLDPAGLTIVSQLDNPATPVTAINASQTLIVWTEGVVNGAGIIAPPPRVVGRLLKSDGTLTAPFKIADGMMSITLGGATATASGFAVLWLNWTIDDFSGIGGWRVTTVDAAGNAGATTRFGPSDARSAAMVRRGSDYLAVARNSMESHDLATDGMHFLEVWSKQSLTHDFQIWAQTVDSNGTPTGTASLLGGGRQPHVTWSGSAFAVVSEASIAFVAADGRVLSTLTPLLPADTTVSLIAGDTIVTRHSAIDTGAGDANVLFVRTFSPAAPRRHAARH